MMKIHNLFVLLGLLVVSLPLGRGEDAAADDQSYQTGNEYIKYWTDYAILPKRCIVSGLELVHVGTRWTRGQLNGTKVPPV